MAAGKTRGQVNYEGYFEASGGVSLVSGAPLPGWEAQDPEIQSAWEAGADRVVSHHGEELMEGLASLNTAVSPVMKAAASALRGFLLGWAGRR